MFKGFREFILRGNVIDLAVAVVIGTAFTAIVTGLVEGVFNPLITLIFNADTLAGSGFTLRPESAPGAGDAVVLGWGKVISALIQFALVASIVYFALVAPMNFVKRRAERRKAEGHPAADPTPTELELLTEIRDLLKAQQPSS
ncbi:MAG: large conductance mechanosensitive channel protein MscL [Pseudolysinimonas sp.]|uniref:large conductance mechanosensitive channel protein MscL n=1 Tax=Pseudolysinimonas sp. TaxID=2680009 RepID=UPI0032645D77